MSIDFGFSAFSYQGSYLSQQSMQSPEDYFKPLLIPFLSRYHLVGCYNPRLMAKTDIIPVLCSFAQASQTAINTIIDVCLPFFESQSAKMYLARYIFFRGDILGVRLSTFNGLLTDIYCDWPRKKVKKVTFNLANRLSSQLVTVGQFSLYLMNARVGLLFEEELKTSMNDYLNNGFDIIALVYQQTSRDNQIISKRNELSKHAIIIEAEAGSTNNFVRNSCLNKTYFNETSLISKEREGIIWIDYYDLTKIFVGKQFLHLNQQSKVASLEPLVVELLLSQEPVSKYLSQTASEDYSFYSVHEKSVEPLSLITDQRVKSFFVKIYKLLTFSQFNKVIILLEQSPVTICILYLFRLLTQTCSEYVRSILLVDMNNKLFEAQLKRMKILPAAPLKRGQIGESVDILIIKALGQIARAEKEQQFFPVISTDPNICSIIKMLNERELIKFEQNAEMFNSSDSSASKADFRLRTWALIHFFTKEEVGKLFFTREIKALVDDDQYHNKLWMLYSKLNDVGHNHSLQEIADSGMSELWSNYPGKMSSLQVLIKQENMLLYHFHLHIVKVQQDLEMLDVEYLFPHYFFKKIGSIELGDHSHNVIDELLLIDHINMLKCFKMLTLRYQPQLRFTHQLALNLIALSRQEFDQKLQCHKCHYLFRPELMYSCESKPCKEAFCYQCILGFATCVKINRNGSFIWQMKQCPSCMGLCSEQCQSCRKLLIPLPHRQEAEQTMQECHFCLMGNSPYAVCSDSTCGKRYCKKCISCIYRDKYSRCMAEGWKCFVCTQNCQCNNCEKQKAQFMNIRKNYCSKYHLELQLRKSNKNRKRKVPNGIKIPEDQLNESTCLTTRKLDFANVQYIEIDGSSQYGN